MIKKNGGNKVDENEEIIEAQPEQPEAAGADLTEDAPVEAEPQAPSELEKVKAEAEEYKRKWYSVTAEYENYRKRTAFTRSSAYAEGRADVVKGLFDIADNLELAVMSCTDEKTRRGIEMVVKAFERLLSEEKITVIDPLGEEFNAETSEAVFAVEPEEGGQSGIVKQVFRKGYEQNGKILRFAQVSVTK